VIPTAILTEAHFVFARRNTGEAKPSIVPHHTGRNSALRFLFFDVLRIREQEMLGVIKHFDEHVRDNLPAYIPNDASYASVFPSF